MRLFLFILFAAISLKSFSQQMPDRKLTDQQTGNLLYIVQYTDIKGSPFLMDNWTNGQLILKDNSLVKDAQLKFDIYTNKFIVNRNDTAYEVSPIIKEIKLYPTADTSNFLEFKNGYSINEKINAKTFLQVIAEGKVTFLRYLKKDMEEYNEYGDATKYKRFTEMNQYFVYANAQYKPVTLSKKNLQDVLSNKWDAVSQYMNQHGLNGKDEKSWKAAIQYYNSL